MPCRRVPPDVFGGFRRQRGYLEHHHHLVVAVCFFRGRDPGSSDTVAGGRDRANHIWRGPTLTSRLPDYRGLRLGPRKLVKKIVKKEYIEIWKILSESWQIQTVGSCCHTKRPRRSLVTDVNVWTECFATMAAILATAYPDKAPHIFACLRTITNASRTFVI